MRILPYDSSKIKIIPTWIWVSFVALTIRIPLLFLPNPGRDEAAYFYWSHHFEPAYSLLMQLIVRFFTFLPLPNLFALRLPSLLMGVLVIFLLDKLLQHRGVDYKFRILALVLFAFCPWQSNFGAMLNPDNFLMGMILLFLICIIKERYYLAAIFAGLATLAKPNGILIIPAAWLVFSINKNFAVSRRLSFIMTSLIFLVPLFVGMKWEMLDAMLEFGKMDPSVSNLDALFLQVLLLLLAGGPLLLFYGIAGVRQRLREEIASENLNLERIATIAISVITVVFFGAALIFNDQVKYNWLLPAAVILWPRNPIPLKKAILIPGIILSIGLGVFQNFVKINPGVMTDIEKSMPGLGSTFTLKGGVREARVSNSNSWSQHLLEYHLLDEFVQQIKISLQRGGIEQTIKWIVCDDYGLASQLVFALGDQKVRMIIPGDGIFHRTMPDPKIDKLPGVALIIAVHNEIESIWERIKDINEVREIRHPITQQQLTIGISNAELSTGN